MTEPMTAQPRCLICHKPRPRWEACPTCQDRLDENLLELLDLYAILDTHRDRFLLPGNEADAGNHRGKRIDPPAPGDLAVMEILDSRTGPFAVMASWLGIIREDFSLAPPAQPETLMVVVGHLRKQLPRICDQHPAVDEFARETRNALRSLDLAVRGPRDRRIPLGECPVVLPADDDEPARACRRPLYHDPSQPTIRCLGCGSTWAGDVEWAWLAALLAS
jgi:hypothetical protein